MVLFCLAICLYSYLLYNYIYIYLLYNYIYPNLLPPQKCNLLVPDHINCYRLLCGLGMLGKNNTNKLRKKFTLKATKDEENRGMKVRNRERNEYHFYTWQRQRMVIPNCDSSHEPWLSRLYLPILNQPWLNWVTRNLWRAWMIRSQIFAFKWMVVPIRDQ